jgi:imidazolonepropionase
MPWKKATVLNRKIKEKVDLLIINANELLTLSGSSEKPRIGHQMRELSIIYKGALAVKEGKILAVGKTSEIMKSYYSERVINAIHKTVLPGFVDAHTHIVFAGFREEEFQMRIEGASYMEILSAGGGILRTVKETRKASFDKLLNLTLQTLDIMLEHGTTTLEAKSGYGLTTNEEIKILEVIRQANQLHKVDVIPTFLGAHTFPPEYTNNPTGYVNLIITEMIPEVAKRKLAKFCDVFCEKGVFNLEQSKRILVSGENYGMKAKIHADEMSVLGGAELAAEVEAISADHLLFASTKGIKAMAKKGVVAVLLPGAAFSLMTGKFANARFMIDCGVPIALGTDFNPSCLLENMQLVIAFACHFMNLIPAEAITAATINAAHAIGKAHKIGSLEPGKKADIVILNAPSHKFLGYHFGVNIVEKVIKNGKIIVDREISGSNLLS